MNPTNKHFNDDELSLKELVLSLRNWFSYLKSKWLIIGLFGVFGSLVGLLYAFTRQAEYTSITTFVLEEDKQSSGFGSLSGLASIAGVDLGDGGGGIFKGDNILELYKSRKMIEKALLTEVVIKGKPQLLIERYIEINNLAESWSKNPNLMNIKFSAYPNTSKDESLVRLKDSIIGVITTDINTNYLKVLKLDKKLSIINAKVISREEYFSKLFNEQIVKTVNDFYVQTKTKRSTENVDILQQKVDSVRKIMNGAIYTSAAIQDATANLNPTRQLQRSAPIQRSQFSAETNKIILGELLRNLELSKIALRKETPLIQIVDSPVFPLQKTKFGKAKGVVIGGFLFGFLIVAYLTVRRGIKYILAEK